MDDILRDKAYRLLVAITVGIIGFGTVFYHLTEHFGWVDAYYFSVITLTTIGYGDLVPHTLPGKVFTTIYVFIGVGIITTFITYTMKRRVTTRALKKGKPNPYAVAETAPEDKNK